MVIFHSFLSVLPTVIFQWEFQGNKLEVLYHIRPYFVGISPLHTPYFGAKPLPPVCLPHPDDRRRVRRLHMSNMEIRSVGTLQPGRQAPWSKDGVQYVVFGHPTIIIPYNGIL